MEKLVAYKRMPVWNKDTMPEAVQRKHNTKVGTWGKITVLKGTLKFIELTEERGSFQPSTFLKQVLIILWHNLKPGTEQKQPQKMWNGTWNSTVNWRITSLRNTIAIQFIRKFLEAMDTVKPCKALDLGCGQGRNALFLAQHGFDVTAVDQNELSLEILQSIVEQEDLEMPVGIYDINSASIGQTYDFIVSTVVLMFCKQIAFQLLSKTCRIKPLSVATI